MSIYISIGNACNVKYQIDKFKGKKETLFFDWLMTDMASVNTILNCKDINKILNPNFIKKKENKGIHSKIYITSLSFCVSIHDLPCEYTNEDIHDFIEKYKRRFLRIIDYIKGNKKIYLIRYGNITLYEKKNLMSIIKNINPNCNYVIVSIMINQDKNQVIKEKNYLQINLIENPNDDWTTSSLDWNYIFTEIDKV